MRIIPDIRLEVCELVPVSDLLIFEALIEKKTKQVEECIKMLDGMSNLVQSMIQTTKSKSKQQKVKNE